VVAESVVVGPVTRIDAAARTLQVLGLPARADRNTLLEGIERIDQLAVGSWVEVFGLRLPGSDGTLATRIIARPAPADGIVEVSGALSEVTTNSITTQGLRIDLGAALIGIANPGGIDFSPAPPASAISTGALVRIRGTYDPAAGRVTATTITTGFAPVRTEAKLVYIEGFVLEQTTPTRFRVSDLAVDTTDTAALTVGTRVRLRGRMQAGVLRVDQVSAIAPEAQIEYVVEGSIASFASVADFTVRGERIDASLAVFRDGAASSLANGRRVRVMGVAGPGKLSATEVTVLN
jgi:hypothetical protein